MSSRCCRAIFEATTSKRVLPICDDAAANPSMTPPATIASSRDPEEHLEVHETRLAMPFGPGHRSPSCSWHDPRAGSLPDGAHVDTLVIGVAGEFLDGVPGRHLARAVPPARRCPGRGRGG